MVGYLETENIAILRWEQKVKSGLVCYTAHQGHNSSILASAQSHHVLSYAHHPNPRFVQWGHCYNPPPASSVTSQVWRRSPSSPYLVHIGVGDGRPANQLVLLLEELSQLEVESRLDALDGFFVLWPLATAFHVADD